MGAYPNPSKSVFSRYLEDEIYVDKTAVLKYLNQRIGKDSGYVCLTRPRRFGKSMPAARCRLSPSNALSFRPADTNSATTISDHPSPADSIRFLSLFFILHVYSPPIHQQGSNDYEVL